MVDDTTSANIAGNGDQEDQITAFEAANYAFEMTDQLRRMAEDAGFKPLAKALDLAHDLAAQSMVDARRWLHVSGKPLPDDAA